MTTANGGGANGHTTANGVNGHGGLDRDAFLGRPRMTLNRSEMEGLISNALTMRRDWLTRMGDPRRDIAAECGYPANVRSISAWEYQDLYDKDPIAKRVVDVLPKECWQVQPLVYETDDPEVVTPFEQAWDDLGKSLRGEKSWYKDEEGSPVWDYLLRADVLSGIGHFGIILLGIDDGLPLDVPAEGVMPDSAEEKPVEATPKPGNPAMASTPVVPLEKQETGVPERQTEGQGPGQQASVASTPPDRSPAPVKPSDEAPPPIKPAGQAVPPKDPDPYRNPTGSFAGTDAQYRGGWSPPEPAAPQKSSGKRKLLYLRVFPESLVEVVQFESNFQSPRFGQPVMYNVTMNDPRAGQHSGIGLPLSTMRVHWTRVIHVVDGVATSEVFGVPRMRPVLLRLRDLEKVYGGDAEAFWKGCLMKILFETHPQLGGEVDVDLSAMRDMMENFGNGLQGWLYLSGMSGKTVAPAVVDPTAHINVQIEAICIEKEIPIRVFKGSERGELASSQDDAAWNDRLKNRQRTHITPRLVIPFVDRLIAMKVLPEPKGAPPKPVPGIDPLTGKPTMGQGQVGPDGKPLTGPDGKPITGPDGKPAAPGRPSPFGPKAPQPRPGASEEEGSAPSFPPKRRPAFNAPPPFGRRPGGPPQPPSSGSSPVSRGQGRPPFPSPQEDADAAVDDIGETDELGGGLDDPQKSLGQAVAEEKGYRVEWPDLTSQTSAEKAAVLGQKTAAYAQYVSGGLEAVIPPLTYMTQFDDFTEEEAQAILESAEADAAMAEQEEMAKQAQMIEQGLVPDPTDPEQVAAHNPPPIMGPGGPPGAGGPPKPGPGGPPKPGGGFPPKGGPPGAKPGGGNPFGKPPGGKSPQFNSQGPISNAWTPVAPANFAGNAFCPTGEGGGQDNSCPPGQGGGSSSSPVGVGKVVSMKGTTLYRATNHPDQPLRDAQGGHQAFGAGVYLGEDPEALKGYGGTIVKYEAPSGKMLEVAGDREFNKVAEQAKSWANKNLQDHLADVAKGAKIDPQLVARSAHPAEQIRDYLEAKGIAGLRYKKVDAVNDHDDQVLVFRPEAVTKNAFCPTGEGGGHDNSCSSKEGGGDEPDYGSGITDRLAATAEAKMEFEDALDDLTYVGQELDKTREWESELAMASEDADAYRSVIEEADALVKSEDFVEAAKLHLEISTKLLEDAEHYSLTSKSILPTDRELGKAYVEAGKILATQANRHKRLAEELHNDYKPSPTRGTRNAFCPTGEGGGIDPSCGGEGGSGPAPSPRVKAPDPKALELAAKTPLTGAASPTSVQVAEVGGKKWAIKLKDGDEAQNRKGAEVEQEVTSLAAEAGVKVAQTFAMRVGFSEAAVSEYVPGQSMQQMTQTPGGGLGNALARMPREEIDRQILFDYAVGFSDGHNGNYIVADGTLTGIDKEFSLGFDNGGSPGAYWSRPEFTNYFRDEDGWRVREMGRDEVVKMAGHAAKMVESLKSRGKTVEAEYVRTRAGVLAKLARLPRPTLGDLERISVMEDRGRVGSNIFERTKGLLDRFKQ